MNNENEKVDINKFELVKHIHDMEQDIDRHKWFESEKEHHDIGIDRAYFDWIIKGFARKFDTEHPHPSS